ncbi:hypothetical protein [Bacteroides oleiciplenus]|uniref:Uncharacterized protein n=1 Tax=Bacteroides oleiciplenus TaxID=626931 RepID=A0A3E5BG28_9BACE|nr:hypothetical protein [Bacteroides oleiciplenus]RGN36548.1 hypothetical protein DXB65_09120 [Bacteroides oleiciplenus]
MKKFLLLSICIFLYGHTIKSQKLKEPLEYYNEMQRNLATGWNTWDTRSVLTHVLLPYGAAVDLNVMDTVKNGFSNYFTTSFLHGTAGGTIIVR